MSGEQGPAYVFWTGGADSTFRVCELLLVEQRDVVPVYVVTARRRSLRMEIATMRTIRAALEERTGTAKLAPTLLRFEHEIAVPERLRRALDATRAAGHHLGDQYLYLGALAASLRPAVPELCVEFTHSPLQRELFDLAGCASTFQARDDHVASPLFPDVSFPLLGRTKSAMRVVARDHGFHDVLGLAWFCHDPVAGRPCGTCRPCHQRRHDQPGTRFIARPLVPLRQVGRYAWRAAELVQEDPDRLRRRIRERLVGPGGGGG
jgi:hypothetical protein